MLNLSAGGWMMESDHSLEPGTFVGLRLSLPDLDAPMEVNQALVLWARGGRVGLKPIRMEMQEWRRFRRLTTTLQEASFSRF